MTTQNTLNIVFAGTPAFTCPALDALYASKHTLAAIYTQPDRPKGRGQTLQASDAKRWALSHNIPVYQPKSLKNEAAQDELRALTPDVLVVIAYGLILPQAVLDIPRFGCINVHASLLPNWRGAAPIQYSLLHGDRMTGVSIMQMDAGMDTGPVLKTVPCEITPYMTASLLHDKLAQLACAPLIDCLDALAQNTPYPAIPQDNAYATYASKITKQDAKINWSDSAVKIDQQIRAFNPWPVAHTQTSHAETIRIYTACPKPQEKSSEAPGTILSISKQGILVSTGDGVLEIHNFQFPGGKALHVADWLNSNKKNVYEGMLLS